MRKARVFISCGQRNLREKNIGVKVENFFRGKGFSTYFAERVHSPEALTENIFSHLESSEYFVFIDFKRDKLNAANYRGSLFVNQELAIATYLKIPNLGFHEQGVLREGIANFQIYNSIPFKNVNDILTQLNIETQNWDVNSVNELFIDFDPQTIQRNIHLNSRPTRPLSDWWTLEVYNRHNKKHAYNCLAYLSKLKDVRTNIEFEIPTLELIWAGLGDYRVNIMAKGKRAFDAFYIVHENNRIRFQSRPVTTTISKYRLPELPNGEYIFEYTITSSNFDMAKLQLNVIHDKFSNDLATKN